MDLETFVSTTLQQIVKGVRDAQRDVPRGSLDQAEIVPSPGAVRVRFDVAVVATEQSDRKGTAGIVVVGLGLGGQAASSVTNQSHSRIQFEVPVRLPSKGQKVSLSEMGGRH